MGHRFLVGRRPGIDDLEHASGVGAMCRPAGPNPDDLLVQQCTDQAAVADDQALAGNTSELDHLAAPRLPVVYEVDRDLLQAFWSAEHLLDHPERILYLALLLG